MKRKSNPIAKRTINRYIYIFVLLATLQPAANYSTQILLYEGLYIYISITTMLFITCLSLCSFIFSNKNGFIVY